MKPDGTVRRGVSYMLSLWLDARRIALNLVPFRCGECGDTVGLDTGIARTRQVILNVDTAIPDDFPIPTCPTCGEMWHLPEVFNILDIALLEQARREILRRVKIAYKPKDFTT